MASKKPGKVVTPKADHASTKKSGWPGRFNSFHRDGVCNDTMTFPTFDAGGVEGAGGATSSYWDRFGDELKKTGTGGKKKSSKAKTPGPPPIPGPPEFD